MKNQMKHVFWGDHIFTFLNLCILYVSYTQMSELDFSKLQNFVKKQKVSLKAHHTKRKSSPENKRQHNILNLSKLNDVLAIFPRNNIFWLNPLHCNLKAMKYQKITVSQSWHNNIFKMCKCSSQHRKMLLFMSWN